MFELLEQNRIPTSPRRIVALHRSRNVAQVPVDGVTGPGVAFLATAYTLRGTYATWLYLAWPDQAGGALLGGRATEVAVTRFRAFEIRALEWLIDLGFEMDTYDLGELAFPDRVSALGPMPFAHEDDDIDALHDVPAPVPVSAAPAGVPFADLFPEHAPREALKVLRDIMISG